MSDLIDRQTAIEALHMHLMYRMGTDSNKKRLDEWINNLPSAQPDIIRCKDCKYWREHKYAKETKRYIPFCGFSAIYTEADDYCSKAERR